MKKIILILLLILITKEINSYNIIIDYNKNLNYNNKNILYKILNKTETDVFKLKYSK
jgi:hypothetical protein|tara:strand:+ start:789 stop:959 length:171 start_codon:yes stop_codon:yes gene_type:complete